MAITIERTPFQAGIFGSILLKMRMIAVYIVLGGLFALPARADQPLLSRNVPICSPDGVYCAADVKEETVFYLNVEPQKVLWRIPGRHENVFLSNDGYVAVARGLLPLNCGPDVVLIQIWKHGSLVHQIHLVDLRLQRGSLERTASHYYWGATYGFNSENKLLVSTIAKRSFSIEPASGKLVESSSAQ